MRELFWNAVLPVDGRVIQWDSSPPELELCVFSLIGFRLKTMPLGRKRFLRVGREFVLLKW